MKKSIVLLRILTTALIIVSSVSCIRETLYVADYILVNSSGRTLELLKYNNGSSDSVVIDNGKECVFFRCSGERGYSVGLFMSYFIREMDSVIIRFEDGKKIIYKPYPNDYPDSINSEIKNIYNLLDHYERTKIDTKDDGESYNEERFYITPEDYELAK